MKIKKLREKDTKELNSELISLLREQLNLHMQAAHKQLRQTHLLKRARLNIARVKTLLTEKAGKNE